MPGCKTPVPIEEFSGVFSLISQLQGLHYEKPLKKRSGSQTVIQICSTYIGENLRNKKEKKKCLKKKVGIYTLCLFKDPTCLH